MKDHKNNETSFDLAKKLLGREVQVTIDRPLGTKHPKYGFLYEVNYGYTEGIIAPDGDYLDAYFLGIKKAVSLGSGVCIAIAHRRDNDDDKLIVTPKDVVLSDNDIMSLIYFQEKWFKTEIIR